jgi:flagellar biosynthesis GTPase FlhF
VSYLSAGQRVPEDLEAATRQRLVDLVLGEIPTVVGAEPTVLAEVAH